MKAGKQPERKLPAETEPTERKPAEKKYAKEQILSSNRYRGRRDLAGVLLRGEGLYTISEIDSIIDEFSRKEVN